MTTVKGILICLCVAWHVSSRAQVFGGNPPAIKWRQINGTAARVIFPAGLDSTARSVAGIVQQLSHATTSSIGNRQQKVDIVLQQETTISNAYVQLGPFRSEFYLTPDQNSFAIGSLPWHEQLAIHEFRHVQQNNNFNVGLSHVFRILFGQEAQALVNNLVIPNWFYEGDAVYNETNVSTQGRGRLPYFFNDYRSLWAAGTNYSWMKLRNGSLRDFTPDHYRLGYMLVAYGREKYGNDFWKKVTRDAAAFKGLAYPFQKAVRRYAGKDYIGFRNDALQYFAVWAGVKPAHTAGHFIADESYPAYINDSTVIFVKSSYRHIPAFTVRAGGTDKVIRVRDVSLDDQFAYRNGQIVYASFRPDIRWGWRNFSELQLLDVHTGRQKTLTTRTKYFSPDISPDGTTIVAVRVKPGGKSNLDIIDAGNGMAITSVPNPDKLFYTYPKFYSAGEIVAAVRDTDGRMSLAMINGAKGTTQYLTPFSFNVIGFPSIRNDTIVFTASHQGNDRLYAYVHGTGKLYALRNNLLTGITGNYQPVIGAREMMWSNFTARGYQLQHITLPDVQWQQVPTSVLADSLTDFNITAINKNPAGHFSRASVVTSQKYSKVFHLFNFHSLEPLVNDPVYSLTLVGENVLNTLQSEVSYSYNRNEQYHQLGFNAIYGALFPFISAGYTYTINRSGLYHNRVIYWNEGEFLGGASVPLNLSRGRYLTGLNIGTAYVYNQAGFSGVYKDSLGNRSFGYLSSTISFSNRVQQARQHIYPRFAQSLLFNVKKSVSTLDASQWLLSGYLYLPGASVTHSLVLSAAYQQRDTLNQHSFTNNFPFARGYTAENFYHMIKGGVNYHFPLAYPDAGFGNIVYFLRVRANLFFDYTHVTDFYQNRKKFAADFRSAGTEVFFDTKWWNMLPVSFGIRYSYLLDDDLYGGSGRNRFAFILPLNLLQR